ncbi:MAG: TonB-dependent receptor plug domain-containing protein [Muribaculaceae bacterium]|nr:TonB-dependent receptor plug domain-containing protein [Muribaculaceae bacterium]
MRFPIVLAALALTMSISGPALAMSKEQPDTTLRLNEVTVTATSPMTRLDNLQAGAEKLDPEILTGTPAMLGEHDIIKSMQLLPGVNSEGEGSGGIQVRGGTSAQNLILLDGAPLYNPTHVMGLFSTFNEDAVAAVTLFKGPAPAQYGGASSAVVDVMHRPGNPDRFRGTASIGLLSAKAAVEGPIGSRLTYAVAARRSYADLFLKLLPDYKSTIMHFYDVSGKMRWNINSRNFIDLTLYRADDQLGLKNLTHMDWSNSFGALNWRSRLTDRLTLTSNVTGTIYSTSMWMDVNGVFQEAQGHIKAMQLKETLIASLSDAITLDAGLSTRLLDVKSAEWHIGENTERELRRGWESALWASVEGKINEHFGVVAGVRLSLMCGLGGNPVYNFAPDGSIIDAGTPSKSHITKAYLLPEPRLSLTYRIGANDAVRAGFSMASQNLHALRMTDSSLPFDRYALTSNLVKPEKCTQVSLGYVRMFREGEWEISAETYYKDLHNVYDYRDGATMFSDVRLESIILGGRGRSTGLELLLRKNTGRFTGWIAYTLSLTQNRIPGINDGRWYVAANDRRNDLAIVGMFDITDRWRISGSWTFNSGLPLSAPDVKYDWNGLTHYYYARRNGYRAPSAHRLDISATYRKVNPRYSYEWSFGFYNLYNRHNPYIIFFEDDDTKPSGTKAVQYSLFGIVPSVSFTINF